MTITTTISAPAAPAAFPATESGSGSTTWFAPGVYFGLEEDAYHADPALGSSDLRRLIVSPTTYWTASHLNPNRPADGDTPAKARGRAIHKLLLEGREAFDRRYRIAPTEDHVPGVLVTVDDLKVWIKTHNESKQLAAKDAVKLTGNKPELIQRIRAIDATVPIWDDVVAQFEATLAREDAVSLSPPVKAEVEHACAMVLANPSLVRAFTGGASEVSVFWEETASDGTPLRFKSRFDYLKPRTLVDIKSFANMYGKPMREAIRLLFPTWRLDIQARHYLDAYRHALLHVKHGSVFGECPLPAGWENALSHPDDIRFTWVFMENSDAALSMAWELMPSSPIFDLASHEIARAKSTLAEMQRRFQPGEPWIVAEPVHEMEEEDLPVWMRIQIAAARNLAEAA